MIRSELVLRVAAMNPHLYVRDVERVVDAILGRIMTALAQGDRVEMRGFGTFSVRQRAARDGRNPRTGAAVSVEEKTTVHFKPSKVMEERLNLGTAGSAEQGERSIRTS